MATARVQDFSFEYTNAEEFRGLKREIFTEHQYYVDLKTSKPRIIDAGAHIGLATGYFKWLYPAAEIIAIEPNPRLIPLLTQNVADNQWEGVEIVEAALVESEREAVPFFFDETVEMWYSTGGLTKGAWNGKQQSFRIPVKGLPLTTWLNKPVDLLKMDIEGAEQAVLMATGERLRMVKHLIMEYHPVSGNSLYTIEKLLTEQDFIFEVGEAWKKEEGLVLLEAQRVAS